ncbi:MAG: sulfatase [Halobacteriaceae archaeon]
MPDQGPHVVQILTDQQQAAALGAVNDSYHTPNLDRLADSGTLFTNCYTTHPQCSPARSSLVTGQFPHQTGVYTLPYWGGYPLDPESHSVGREFDEAGWDTVWTGKWHLGGDNLEPLGWESLPAAPDEPGDEDVNSRVGGDRRVADRAVHYLRDHDHDEPFFLTASFRLPHPAYLEADDVADHYDEDEVPVPENFDSDLGDRPDYLAERAAELDLSEDDARELQYQYRTMVSQVDAYVGDILDELEAQGVREETVILFASDHGDMTGAHGISHKGSIPFEEILRVPLLVDVPEGVDAGPRAGGTVEDLVSLAAVPGTLLDAAGLDVDPAFEGGSLLDVTRRDAPPETDRVFFEHKYARWGHHPYRAVREDDWKYVQHLGENDGEEELYDLDADPGERENLAGDPDQAERLARLRGVVDGWWEATGGDVRDWVESPIPDDD